jgi:anion-transporting  ArsA/GET3 family ATPase
MLTDPQRCQVVLVTLPEETPVNELVDTAYSLEDEVGVNLGPVVVNGLYPDLAGLDRDPARLAAEAGLAAGPSELAAMAAAATFRRERARLQLGQLERLARALPLPQLRLPYLFSTDPGPNELETLATALDQGIRGLTVLAEP